MASMIKEEQENMLVGWLATVVRQCKQKTTQMPRSWRRWYLQDVSSSDSSAALVSWE